ncbi:MAG: PrsW family intramembrane metalloprotease [Actinomycetota bacterium]
MSTPTGDWSAIPRAAQALPPVTPSRNLRWALIRGFIIGLVALVMIACGFLVAVIIGTDTGVVGFAAGVAFALVPVAIVLPALLWLDRLEAEPVGQLLFAFGWGAVVATLIALWVNSYSLAVLTENGGDISTAAVLSAPWVEEVSKGAAVLIVLLWRRREFDGIVDGIVYAGVAGVGFAFTENVLYMGRSLEETGTAGLVSTFVLRGIVGPFAHPLFTMAIGVGLGVAARSSHSIRRIGAPILGLLIAVVLHGLWNLSAVTGLRGFLGVYALVQVPLFTGAVLFALWARRRESLLIRRHLQAYVATGWITAEEVTMLGSSQQRRAARTWAAQRGGPRAKTAMRGFQDAATDLAFARDRATRTALHRRDDAIESDLLRRATAYRHVFASS